MVIIVVVIITPNADMRRRYHIGPPAVNAPLGMTGPIYLSCREGPSSPRLHGAPLGMTGAIHLSCRDGMRSRSISLIARVSTKPRAAITISPTYIVFTERICQAFQII